MCKYVYITTFIIKQEILPWQCSDICSRLYGRFWSIGFIFTECRQWFIVCFECTTSLTATLISRWSWSSTCMVTMVTGEVTVVSENNNTTCIWYICVTTLSSFVTMVLIVNIHQHKTTADITKCVYLLSMVKQPQLIYL